MADAQKENIARMELFRRGITAKLSDAGGPQRSNLQATCSARIRPSDLVKRAHRYWPATKTVTNISSGPKRNTTSSGLVGHVRSRLSASAAIQNRIHAGPANTKKMSLPSMKPVSTTATSCQTMAQRTAERYGDGVLAFMMAVPA